MLTDAKPRCIVCKRLMAAHRDGGIACLEGCSRVDAFGAMTWDRTLHESRQINLWLRRGRRRAA